MKTFVSTLFCISVLSLLTATRAFVNRPAAALHHGVNIDSSSMLFMGGFLEGKGTKITVREDEDKAMWMDEPAKKKQDKAKKSAPAKKAVAKKKSESKAEFKFPWQK